MHPTETMGDPWQSFAIHMPKASSYCQVARQAEGHIYLQHQPQQAYMNTGTISCHAVMGQEMKLTSMKPTASGMRNDRL
jgi:hypothetical protein